MIAELRESQAGTDAQSRVAQDALALLATALVQRAPAVAIVALEAAPA